MKKCLLIVIFAFAMFVVGCNNQPESGEIVIEEEVVVDSSIYVVTSPQGLNMRTHPTTSSTAIGLILPDERVKVLETSDSKETISSVEAHWHRVLHDERVGWVFGGFLKPESELMLQKSNIEDEEQE